MSLISEDWNESETKKVENRSETGWGNSANYFDNWCFTECNIDKIGLRRKLSLYILGKLYMCERWDSTSLIRSYTIMEMRLFLYTQSNHLCTLASLISSREIARPIFRNLKESCKMTFILSMWSCLFKITTSEPLVI